MEKTPVAISHDTREETTTHIGRFVKQLADLTHLFVKRAVSRRARHVRIGLQSVRMYNTKGILRMRDMTDAEFERESEGAYADDPLAEDVVTEDEAAGDDVEDEAVGDALLRVGNSARSAAEGAGRSFAGGLSALRQVRQASKMRLDAEADVRDIELGLEEDRNELAHREDVERNYHEIVQDQEAELEDARAVKADAEAQIDTQRAEVKRLEAELRAMREQHEQKLRPYRNLMDSSRGRSDDAAKSLANIRRDVRNAERALSEATKNRDARISAAHRAVDAAQERVGAVETELNALLSEADGVGASNTLAKMEGELASNRATLESARSDVVLVTQEAQDAVDAAQRRLLSLQREQTQAERLAETTKAEATARKNEYDGMYRSAQAKERAHEDAIKSCEARIRDLSATRKEALLRIEDAQDMLAEAHEIHAHPETTEGLRQRIADEEEDLIDAQAELEELLESERELRRSTRTSRIIVIAVVVVVVVVIALLVWFFLFRG